MSNELMAIQSLNDDMETALSMIATPFSIGFPQLIGKTESEVTEFLKTNFGFTVTKLSKRGCGFFLIGVNQTGTIGIAKWGSKGHGYVLQVQNTASGIGKQGIHDILMSTIVTEPCSH